MSNRADEIISNGWEQWRCVSRHLLPDSFLTEDRSDCETFVVMTQSCDLAHGCFESEPFVELLGVTVEEKKENGSFINAKNSRELHIPIEGGCYVAVRAANRFFVDRGELASFSPDDPLNFTEQQKTILTTWISSRYYRPAFSEEYMKVWGKVIGKLHDRLKRHYDSSGDGVIGVFVKAIDSDEVDFQSEWLIVYSDQLMDECSEDSEASYDRMQKITKYIGDAIKNDSNIKGTINMKSTEDFSFEEARGFKRVFMDDICLRSDDPGHIPIF